MSVKVTTRFVCQECGYISLRWAGQCTECQAWNSFKEDQHVKDQPSKVSANKALGNSLKLLQDVSTEHHEIFSTRIGELDRVLGKGIVSGSVVLLGGEPGIGKSTLSLQLAQHVASTGKKVLYVTGEESESQIYARSQRLGKNSETLFVLSEVDIIKILNVVGQLQPDLLIIDSIQVVSHPDVPSIAGSVNQVRYCATEVIKKIKGIQCATVLIGHITKDGQLAGPKVLEHLVDVILYFEGERNQHYKVLRCFKNRYSGTQEIGIFEMKETGLIEVGSPSDLFIDGTTLSNPGSVVSAVMEGSRVFLVEVQALVVETGYGMAKRTFLGVDPNRANVMIAAIEKIVGIRLSSKDIIINIIGGLKVSEPALDLGIVLSMVSSVENVHHKKRIGVLGEVGLTGEIRPIPHAEKRVNELKKMGFDGVILPEKNRVERPQTGIELWYVDTINEAIHHFLKL